MTFLQKIQFRFRTWNAQRKLQMARKLIMEVYKNELPGNIIRTPEGKELVIEDIVFSLRKNEIKAHRSPLKNKFTRKQRSAIQQHIKRTNQDK